MSCLTVSTSSLTDELPILDVYGELDLHTNPQLEREIAAAFTGGAPSVTVDLTGCEFLDSSTLTMLFRLQRQLGCLSLVIDNASVLKPFQITGFDQLFPIHSTRAEALLERDRV